MNNANRAANRLPCFFGRHMNVKSPKVDAFIENAKDFKAELEALRDLLLESPLTEEFKWRGPCYTYEDKAVVMLGSFKNYCALGFFKGALMQDPHALMVAPGENSQSMRMIHFTHVEEINALAPVLREYINQAVENEKAGMQVQFVKAGEQSVPEEFQQKLSEDVALKKAFESLTPGRQRAYLIHFSGAKQPQTRLARIEKLIPRILAGKGLQDEFTQA